MDLSLVIPAFNSEAYISKNLATISSYLEQCGLRFEILVVDDGSRDGTSLSIEQANIPYTRLISFSKNCGKFAAISAGMKEATGQVRIFTDADIPFDFETLPYIVQLISKRDFHLVIGDRSLTNSQYASETHPIRRATTFLFSAFVRMFVTGGLFDTQCGLKGFRGDVAEAIFPLLRTTGFSGDVELLYIALKYNLEIKRIPVRLRNAAPSSVRIFSDGMQMFSNIVSLKLHWMQGKYKSPALEQIARQDYWQATSESK